MAALFRNEVLEARRGALFGSVVLRPPLSFAGWCLGSIAASGALIALLCLGQYTKRTRIQGITVPSAGLVKLTSPQPGIVVERHVDEGRRVRAGDVLFVVSSERITDGPARGAGAQAAILQELTHRRASLVAERHRRAGLHEQQEQGLVRRRTALLLEVEQLRREVATQTLRENSSAEQAARFEELSRQGFVSPLSVTQRWDDLLDHRARRQALERNITAIQREVAAVDGELAQVPLRSAQEQAEIGRAIALLQQEIAATEAARRVVITAPRDGLLAAVVAERGQAVASQPLATLLPTDASMEVHLFAPSRAVGFVRAGQAVRVRFAAYPFQKFGQYDGEVTQVSPVALPPAELPAQLAPPLPHESLYRITVKLAESTVTAYGSAQPLTAGMQVEADVMQDRRRLIEWVFEPVIALGRKI